MAATMRPLREGRDRPDDRLLELVQILPDEIGRTGEEEDDKGNWKARAMVTGPSGSCVSQQPAVRRVRV